MFILLTGRAWRKFLLGRRVQTGRASPVLFVWLPLSQTRATRASKQASGQLTQVNRQHFLRVHLREARAPLQLAASLKELASNHSSCAGFLKALALLLMLPQKRLA